MAKHGFVDDENGNAEERSAVRAACEALKTLNSKLEICAGLGVACRLESQGSGYLADFTKTTRIFPGAR